MIFKKTYLLNLDVLNKCCWEIDSKRLGLIIKRLVKSINADCMYVERLDEHDVFFIPKTESEKVLWESLRVSAKAQMNILITSRENGKKGGRPPKKEEVLIEPELPPIKITTKEEEFLEWAKQMNESAGFSGFKNSVEQAKMFWNHFDSQGWRKKNGMPITNVKSAYKLWVIKDKTEEDDIPEAPVML